MKRLVALIIINCLLQISGCARFSSTVTETKDAGKITQVKVSTLWSSKSDLAKFASGQTDKSQRISIGSLSQEATDTNMVNIIQAVTKGAVEGAAAAIKRP